MVIEDKCNGIVQFIRDVDGVVMQPMTPNSFGTHNNVITVQKSDFEAFEALGVDSLKTGHHDDNYYIKYGMYVKYCGSKRLLCYFILLVGEIFVSNAFSCSYVFLKISVVLLRNYGM